MAGNPLVAERTDTATEFSGASLLDDSAQLSHAIESGDWVEGGVAAVSLAIDTVAAVSDPLGTLIGHGLGWLIDHLEPLKGWLDDLTGDAGEVQAFSQTWSNISTQLSNAGRELTRILSDVEGQAGQTMRAYRAFQQRNAQHVQASAGLAAAFSTGLGIASTIVQVVHDLVRDVLSQLVGSIISWVAEAVFSVGLATPWVIEQVSTRVASLATRVGTKLTSLLASVGKLKGLLAQAQTLLKRLSEAAEKGLGRSVEALAAQPGLRRLDPRRNRLMDDLDRWAAARHRPNYQPYGSLSRTDYIDTHLANFNDRGFPEWRWPGEKGFDSSNEIVDASSIVTPGDRVTRWSPVPPNIDSGEFATLPGTDFPEVSLPADRNAPVFQEYTLEIKKPLPAEVRAGIAAPAFEQPGGAIQFVFPDGIRRWVESGHLEVVTR